MFARASTSSVKAIYPLARRMIPLDAHVVLIGLMGVGKSTVGEQVARLLDRGFVDCDAALHHRTGRTAAEVAAADGLGVLHDLEAVVLLDAVGASPAAVITAAASTIEDQRCRDALRNEYVVWLRADLGVLARRVATSPHRPIGDDAEVLLSAQAARRDPLFAGVADVEIDASERSPEEIANAIVD